MVKGNAYIINFSSSMGINLYLQYLNVLKKLFNTTKKKITDIFWILKNMGDNISLHDPHLKSVSLNFEKHGREYLSPWSPLKKCFFEFWKNMGENISHHDPHLKRCLLGNTSKCGLHHIVSKNILNNQIIK